MTVSDTVVYKITTIMNTGVPAGVVKFQDKVFSKFQDILRSQNVENHYVLCTTNVVNIQKGAITTTKAMLHKKP